MLAAVYVLLFVLQIVLLIRGCRTGKGLGRVLALNILVTVLAVFLLWYFDTLPGFGIMPGFAFFAEVMYSLVAAVVFALLTLVTFLCRLYFRKK